MTTHSINPIHLYRNLLRETSYLCDTTARQYFREYITSSFRSKLSAIASRNSKQTPHDEVSPPSLDGRRQLKRGRKLLSTITRANQGYVRAITNVLRATYARKGQRRRELMREYTLKEPSGGTRSAATSVDVSAIPNLNPKGFTPEWKPSPLFTSLVRSQHGVQTYLGHTATVKLSPTIPEKNRAGRPMPECRVRNQTKRWYARTASLLLPHLGKEDGDRIREKAAGKDLTVPTRRTMGSVKVFTVSSEPQAELGKKILEDHSKHLSRRKSKELGNPHKMTKRFLSRLYARSILRQTPLLVAHTTDSGAIFHWQDGMQKLPRKLYPVNIDQAEILFGN